MQETKPPARPQRARLVVPSRSDLLLKNFTEVIGGPMGARSAPGLLSPGVFTVERVLIILTVLAALASLAVKGYCRTNGWQTPGQFYSTCYSDFPEFFRNRGLGEDPFTFLSQGTLFEYPALLGFIAGTVAWLVPGDGVTDSRILGYFDANATLIAAVWIVTVLATARMSQRRPWDAAMVALAPCIVLAGTINWDLWAVGLLAAGMLCFARERLVLAGILFGLAAATKPYAALILAAIFLLAVRTGRIRAFLVTVGSAMVAWLAVNIPVAVANPAGWGHSFGVHPIAGARLRFRMVRLQPGSAAPPLAGPGSGGHQCAGPGLLPAGMRRCGLGGADGPQTAPPGTTGIPAGRRPYSDEQGLLTPVCTLAHSAPGTGQAAVARFPGVARGGRPLLGGHLDVPGAGDQPGPHAAQY